MSQTDEVRGQLAEAAAVAAYGSLENAKKAYAWLQGNFPAFAGRFEEETGLTPCCVLTAIENMSAAIHSKLHAEDQGELH